MKVWIRAVLRDPFYSAVNVIGLALGMTCCLLITLFVVDEYSFDRWPEKSDRIFRIVTPKGGQLPPPLGPILLALPEVEDMVRIHSGTSTMIVHGERRNIEWVRFVDGNFPELFNIEFIFGDPRTALEESHKMVLSEEMAAKYFGDRDPRGEIFSWDGRYDYEISGVAKVPSHTHFHFDILASLTSMDSEQFWYQEDTWRKDFEFSYRFVYVVLSDGVDSNIIPQKAHKLVGQVRGREAQEILEGWGGFRLQKLTDIHLHSRLPVELDHNGRVEDVYVAIAVALLVLLVASVNYVNLSVARATRRAREIGIRKSVGANRWQLVRQLLSESVLVCLLALVLSLTIVQLALPWFNAFFNKSTSMMSHDGWIVLEAAVAAVVVGLLSGCYPALVISSWLPERTLRGRAQATPEGRRFVRHGLVCFQFAVSVALIVMAGVVFDQLRYIESTDLGYTKERVLLAQIDYPGVNQKMPAFHEALRSHTGVEATTSFKLSPSSRITRNAEIQRLDSADEARMGWLNVAPGFFRFFNMELAAGRTFLEGDSDQFNTIIINESALATLGFSSAEEAIDRPVSYRARGTVSDAAMVIGVVRDVHFESLHEPIRPMAFGYATGEYRFYYTGVRIRAGRVKETLAFVKQTWKQVIPDFPMGYHFLDEEFQTLYEGERRLGQMLGIFAALAALIACIGALAMSLFSTKQRTKEIGVRKVMGATDRQIVILFSMSFTWPLVIAIFIAWPSAYFGADTWLEEFAYRTEFNPVLFAASGAALLIVIWLTVGYQALRATRGSIVDALRYE